MTGTGIAVLAVLGVVAYLYFRYGDTIKEIITVDLNPVNPENVANSTFNTISAPVLEAAGGKTGESFGEYCVDHKSNPLCWGFMAADAIIPQ